MQGLACHADDLVASARPGSQLGAEVWDLAPRDPQLDDCPRRLTAQSE